MSKYRAKRTKVDGIWFQSGLEAKYYSELKVAARCGRISHFELQPNFCLQEKFTDSMGNKHREICYRGDFAFTRDGRAVVVDVKGAETPVYKLKKKLFLKKYPEIHFEEWK